MTEKKEITKEPKVKKLFTIEVTVWEDGECEAAMSEFVDSPTGRGRPGKWRRTPVEFVQRVEETLGDFNKCLVDWNNAIGKEAKQYLALNSAPALSQVVSAQATASSSQIVEKKEEKKPKEDKKSKKESDTPEKDSPEDDGFGDIEFGEFDKPKDK